MTSVPAPTRAVSLGRVLRGHPRHRQYRHRGHAVSHPQAANEGIALGYVAARVLESTIIVVGFVSLLRS
jgi:hypothetical protein